MVHFDIHAIPDEDLGMFHADPATARAMVEAIGRGVTHCRAMAETENGKTKLKQYLKANEKAFAKPQRHFLRRAIKLVNQCGMEALLEGLCHAGQTPLYTIRHTPYYTPILEALERDNQTRSPEFVPTEAEAVTRTLMLIEEGHFPPGHGGLYKQAFPIVRAAMPEKNAIAILRGVDLAVQAVEKAELAPANHAHRATRHTQLLGALSTHLNKVFPCGAVLADSLESAPNRPYTKLKSTPRATPFLP